MNSYRWKAIEERAGAYPYAKHAQKLKPEDWALIRSICEADASMSIADFEMKANRLFLDNPKKPKGWTTICALLSAANTCLRAHFKESPECQICAECVGKKR